MPDPSYNSALTTSKDRARLLLGDTGVLLDANSVQVWLLADATITALIAAHGFAEGVAQAADGLCTRFAQEPDEYQDEGGVRVRWNERIAEWRNLARKCRSGEISAGSTPSKNATRYAIGKLQAPGIEGFK